MGGGEACLRKESYSLVSLLSSGDGRCDHTFTVARVPKAYRCLLLIRS